ncbi:MAG: arylamine N-acetyltransferase [Bacteroidetes bacterium SW_9_63_38]|nr:MAG: arylamine N-acetyltransferase [Bacteroidetes bacterium SW_9_63_38]
MDTAAYLARIGLSPASVDAPTVRTLRRLQRAHVTTVPFENLSIVGRPPSPDDAPGVDLSPAALYEKIVEHERGGYCFELNGLFRDLMVALGYEVDRLAARVTSALQTPANHHVLRVHLDEPLIVDVGTGPPMLRRPLPLDGSSRTDEAGVVWRVVASERSDTDYCAEVRPPDASEWSARHVFTATPRPHSYFDAANEYLQSAPESPFTGDPLVALSTDDGCRRLAGETLTHVQGSNTTECPVPDAERADVSSRFFGLF